MVDDMDFFIESINPENSNQYLYNDSYQRYDSDYRKNPFKK
jgi:acyl-homoserine lactone acylase PvdQ